MEASYALIVESGKWHQQTCCAKLVSMHHGRADSHLMCDANMRMRLSSVRDDSLVARFKGRPLLTCDVVAVC